MPDQVLDIKNLRALKRILKKYGVSIKGWGGVKHTKPIRCLMEELTKGDCILVLRAGRLVRIAWRAQAYIFREEPEQTLLLTERQIFSSGHKTRRNRDISVSEKYYFGKETPLDGMLRGIHEELSIKFPIRAWWFLYEISSLTINLLVRIPPLDRRVILHISSGPCRMNIGRIHTLKRLLRKQPSSPGFP